MAYGRSLSTRVTLTARAYSPSFSYVLRDHDRKEDSPDKSLSQRDISNFIQQRSFGSRFNSSYGSGAFFNGNGVSQFSLGSSAGSAFVRYMSTTGGEGPDKIELMSDVADGLSDAITQVVANHASAVNEVAIAAADSFLPVAALQHFIGAIHNFTGLNWWGSIVVTSLLIQSAKFPFFIHEVEALSQVVAIKPQLEKIIMKGMLQMQNKGMDHATKDVDEWIRKLYKECDVSSLMLLKRTFIPNCFFIFFFLAISNMVEKVPSFKSGGVLWFTDLTTPDSFYILPILTGLSYLISVERSVHTAGSMKNIFRAFAVLLVPLTMIFPKAIVCYWITSNLLFSIMLELVLKVPEVKKA